MPPAPRVVKAFCAMKELGISEDIVKPVLKELLRVYEKNWNLIEEENYRVLADAIFDSEENKREEHNNLPESNNVNNFREDVRDADEPRKAKKRLRLKYQDQAVSYNRNVLDDSGGSSSKMHKIDSTELPGSVNPQMYPETGNSSDIIARRAKGESFTDSSSMRSRPKGKQHASSQALVMQEGSYLKVPKPEPGMEDFPQKKVPSSLMLIKPKDEPCTDVANNDFLLPIAVILPGDALTVNGLGDVIDGQQKCESQSRQRNDGGDSIRASSGDRMSQNLCGSEDIASLSVGDIQISLKCNYIGRPGFHVLSLSSALKLVEDKFRNVYNVDSNFSVTKLMKDICNSCLELGSQSTSEPQQQDLQKDVTCEQHAYSRKVNDDTVTAAISPTKLDNPGFVANKNQRVAGHQDVASDTIPPDEICVTGDDESINRHCGDGNMLQDVLPLKVPCGLAKSDQNGDKENENINGEEYNGVTSESVATGEPAEISARIVKPKIDVEDITRGQESVNISMVNEVDNSSPPSFFYIPQNLKYQNACVNILLARIGNEDCCSGCSGDCLSSKIPCACAQKTGGEFTYTSDELLKESILEECISMNRDPKKQCRIYCKDKECPLERPKGGDMMEPCKGHLVRKFIKECWRKCGCDKQCGNRLVQRGITHKLQVFMTPNVKGWGLRTLEHLAKGTFVCEYVGEILTNSELFDRNMQSTLKRAYPAILDADWGSENVLNDEEALCLDATTFGNVARFINHRCFDSNMVEIPVEVETPDRHYYHLAFFTTRDVAAMEELTWDYGIDFDDQKHPANAFKCNCGSKFCRNIKRTRRRHII